MSADRAGDAPATVPGAAALPQMEPILAVAGDDVPELLERTEERLGEVAASEGAALGRHASQTLAAGGKRLRPLLVFLCAGGGRDARLVAAAVAVELVHMAALVHDDVLDRAALRRGHPTVYESAGRRAATATGDFLFSRAFAELARTEHRDAVRALSAASSALARGELMQRADAWSDSVTVERYSERCSLKTARLFEAACRLGALFGQPGGRGTDGLGAYGSEIGLAFQIFDDVLDVAGPTERTGKRRGTDLLDGTVTLPLIIARTLDREVSAVDLRSITDPESARELCDRIAASGALERARAVALGHVEAAKAALGELQLSDGQRRALGVVADGVVERYG